MTNSVIWESTLDNQFECKVLREEARVGVLIITDNTTGEDIFTRPVSLSYGAQFGPDIDDVQLWQHLCVEAIDNR
jgi:hypothetical protein